MRRLPDRPRRARRGMALAAAAAAAATVATALLLFVAAVPLPVAAAEAAVSGSSAPAPPLSASVLGSGTPPEAAVAVTCELAESEFLPPWPSESSPSASTRPPPVAALASYPRSGNSFLRGLLERATGLVTCARGSDPKLMALGFRGHRVDPQSARDRHRCLAHKTHVPMNHQQLTQHAAFPEEPGAYSGAFGRVVVLVRNPFDVAFSSWHYFGPNSSHSALRVDAATGAPVPVERGSAGAHADMWARHVRYWLDRTVPTPPPPQPPPRPLPSPPGDGKGEGDDADVAARAGGTSPSRPRRLVVRYEDLKRAPEFYTRRIVQWLGHRVDEERLACALAKGSDMVYKSANYTPFHSLAHIPASAVPRMVSLATPALLCGFGYAEEAQLVGALDPGTVDCSGTAPIDFLRPPPRPPGRV